MTRFLFILILLASNCAIAQSTSVRIWDGTRTASVRDTGSNDSVNVAITDASGNHVTSFGGGTQYNEDAAHSSGDTGTMCLGVRRDTASTLASTDGDYSANIYDSSGRLWVNGSGVTQPVSGTVTANAGSGTFSVDSEIPAAATITDNITGFSSTPHLMSLGMMFNGTGWDRVRGDTSNGLDVDVTRVSGSVTVTDGSGNLTVDGTVTCNAGTNLNTSTLATESTLSTLNGKVTACNTGAVTVSSALPSGTNTIGIVRLQDAGAREITIKPSTTAPTISDTAAVVALAPLGNLIRLRPDIDGGLLIARFLDLDETDVEVKGSRGQLYGYFLFNSAASTRYFKLYDGTTGSVIVGTTTPVITIPVPAGSAANVEFTQGIAFPTAITAACTTGIADTDTGAPGANECVANFFFN